MTTYATSDFALLEEHPRAALRDTTSPCGGGFAQEGLGQIDPCPELGGWQLTRPWGGHYQHTYCTNCAARRLRADERMRVAAQLAEERRTTT